MSSPRVLLRRAPAVAIVAVLIVVGFLLIRPRAPAGPSGPVTCDEAVANVAKLRTVHWESIDRDGWRTELWAANPDRLRVECPDGTYRIYNGPDLWVVAPKGNRAVHKRSPH